RFDAAFSQRLVDGARNQAVRDIVQDLIAEPLTHHLRWHFTRAKAGHARGAAVVARHLIYFRVDHGAWNLDDEVFLCVADVDEFGFHFYNCSSASRSFGASARQPSPCANQCSSDFAPAELRRDSL